VGGGRRADEDRDEGGEDGPATDRVSRRREPDEDDREGARSEEVGEGEPLAGRPLAGAGPRAIDRAQERIAQQHDAHERERELERDPRRHGGRASFGRTR
jgi:hypothetical protein